MRRFVVLSVLCASWLVGCGDPYVAARDGGGGGEDGGVTPDGATPLEDGGKTDTATGADTKPAEDVGSPGDPCTTPGKSESAKCGKCGSQVRVCNSDKTWSEWSSCSGEGVCTAYETATEACSGGGTRSRSCTSSCTWGSWGSCEGAPPPCGTLGKTETQTCGKCGSQLRTCGATGWSAWGTCGGEGECTSGATESAACGTGGTKTRTCGTTCTWGAYGTCVGGTPTTGCASGSPRQTFSSSSFSGMWGCSGTSTWSGASTLCASGYHVCSATEFSSRRGTTIPSHHYWVSDYLNGSGSEGACKASKSTASGNFCPTDAPMRVCGSSKYDASGNYCTWVACGYESTSSSLYYGGCNDDGSSHGLQAGALCCN